MMYQAVKIVGEIGNSGEFSEFFRVKRFVSLEETPQRGTYIIIPSPNKGELFYIGDIVTSLTGEPERKTESIMWLFSKRGISRYEYMGEDDKYKDIEMEYFEKGWYGVGRADHCRIFKYEVY